MNLSSVSIQLTLPGYDLNSTINDSCLIGNEERTNVVNQTSGVNHSSGVNLLQQHEKLMAIRSHMLLFLQVVIMLSMGCKISWTRMKNHFKQPVAIGIGAVCQFFIVPLTAYALMRSNGITGLYAIVALTAFCCPGGPLSNATVYFCNGDLELSLLMSSFFTLLMMGFMPLNLWIYGHSYETGDLIVPYGNIALHFVTYIVALLGMGFKWKSSKWAMLASKIGSYVGWVILIFCAILEVIFIPNILTDIPKTLCGIVFMVPVLGSSLGFVLAYSFKLNPLMRRTIAIECGVQNITIVLVIISNSLTPEIQEKILVLPWLHSFILITSFTLLSIIYQLYNRYLIQKKKRENGFDLDVPI